MTIDDENFVENDMFVDLSSLIYQPLATSLLDPVDGADESVMSDGEKISDRSPANSHAVFSASDVSKKSALTNAQKKLSTDLLQLIDESFLPPGKNRNDLRNQMIELRQLIPAEELSSQTYGEASDLVYVYVSFVPSSNIHIIDPYVSEITASDKEHELAVAWVRVDSLESLASLNEVRSIRTVMPPLTRVGSYNTEGDAIHNSDDVRNTYGATGAGMKIGIISDGVDHISTAVASGDLPSNVHVLSNKVGGDEGTAMLEIVHDIAPGAELYFHDCGSNVLEFNNAIDALVNAGCTVVCDDIGWIAEPFFEDGIIGSHVQDVIDTNDILYVSSAGNAANKHYQGSFYDGGDGRHDFSGGTSASYPDLYVDIPPSGTVTVILEWNDQFGSSSNDYDLHLEDYYTGEILAYSEGYQDGDDDPLEGISYTNTGDAVKEATISVYKYSGDPRIVEVYIYGNSYIYLDNLVAEDSIFGHPAVPDAVGVGAIDANDPGNDDVEPFSSRGPVTITYPVPELRQKTDISGIDGVSVTGAGGFPSPFYGTSAAAPHIAAISALVWSAYPDKSYTEIRDMLYSTATDLGNPGYDNVFGYGLADALEMYESGVSQLPTADFTANVTSGDAPFTVQFTDLSTNAASWTWDINGDSVIDYTSQNPAHTYATAGNYSVSLTATNAYGSDTETKVNYITVTESGDWNPWDDPDSDGGDSITTSELQVCINCWINEISAPKTGAEVTTQRLQELISLWLSE